MRPGYVPMRLVLYLALLGLGSCTDEPAESPAVQQSVDGHLVNPFGWNEADEQTDPFQDRRPSTWDCSPTAHFAEQLAGVWVYSIETGECDWLTITQPTAIELNPGDRVVANIWHFELVAPERAMAYLGFAIHDRILVDAEEPIPGPARRIELSFDVAERYPVGTPLLFHLNNHGANSWHIVEVLVNPENNEAEP